MPRDHHAEISMPGELLRRLVAAVVVRRMWVDARGKRRESFEVGAILVNNFSPCPNQDKRNRHSVIAEPVVTGHPGSTPRTASPCYQRNSTQISALIV